MKIIFLENTDPFENFVGGIPTYIRNAAKYIKSQNVQTVFIGSILNRKTINMEEYFNKIYSFSNIKIGHTKFLFLLAKKFFRLKFHRNTLIHSQRLLLCLPFIFKRKYKIICTSHGNEWNAVKERRGLLAGTLYRLIERIVVPRLNRLIVVDPKTEYYFKMRYPTIKDRIIRIPIGIDSTSFYPIPKMECRNTYLLNLLKKNIVFVGRIAYEKNIKLLIDAFCIVHETIDGAELIIAGDGKLKSHYEKYCLENRISNVRFIGSVPPEELADLLNVSDVLVLSSYFEGSPTVVKEALACNLPVVSTDCGDVSEVINGLEKCYIATSEKADFANKIILSLTDPGKYDYSQRIDTYSNDNQFHKLLNIYKDINTNR